MRPLRHAFRRLGRSPVFTTVAVITLALGIGANSAIFSVIDGVLIKPLPYPNPQQLVGVWHLAPGVPDIDGDLDCSPTMYFTYRDENRTFQDFGLFNRGRASVTGMGEPEQVQAIYVTEGVLQALGVRPTAGRWFSRADDTPGTARTAILAYGYWQRRFGGQPVVGRTIDIDSLPRTIIGVMPREFHFLDFPTDVLLPQRFDRNKIFLGDFSYQGIARLKPGVTLRQANADVQRMIGIWLRGWAPPPGFSRTLFENARVSPNLKPLKKQVVGDISATLWVLMGTIGMVLLIACANVANLLLVRAEGRQQELAIRAALGANWKALARELLLESVLLSVTGGAVGLGLAFGAVRLLVAKGPALPRLDAIGIDGLVLAFTAAVSLLAGLLFGLIPAMKYSGPGVAQTLRGAGGRTMSEGKERHRARDLLVVAQVGLALVLLVGSGLMIRTFQALRAVQPGFHDAEHVQLLRVSIPEGQVKDGEQVMRVEQQMLDKLTAIPGVQSAVIANSAPLEGNNSSDVLYAEDKDYGDRIPPIRRYKFITPGYFKTLGTPIIAGRDFTWTDLYDRRMVSIVSDNLAREVWGSPAAALNKRIREGSKDPWREIIGVVGDVYEDGVQTKAPAISYWPALTYSLWGDPVRVLRTATFLIRTPRAGTQGLLAEARRAMWQVNANLPVYQVRTLGEVYATSLARTTFTLVLLAIAGAMALILGVVGIYGVIAYAVSQRRREIGIRMALGAPAREVRRIFLWRGLLLAGIGIGLGLLAAAAATMAMKSVLFGVKSLDAPTYAAAAAVLLAAAALASYVPARRASALDPIETLRAE